MSLGRMHLDSGSLVVGPGLFAIVFLVVPTIAAFGAARMTAPDRGGTYLFAVSASAYLVALGIAALGVAAARSLFS